MIIPTVGMEKNGTFLLLIFYPLPIKFSLSVRSPCGFPEKVPAGPFEAAAGFHLLRRIPRGDLT